MMMLMMVTMMLMMVMMMPWLALRREMMFYITNGVPIPSWTRLTPQTDLPFLYGSPWMDGGISAVPSAKRKIPL